MGFGSPPKPNPALVEAQLQEATRAKEDRISQIQQELGGEDQARAQIYGTPPGGGSGSTSTGTGSSGGSGGGGGFGFGGWGFAHSV
jgi:hypothetical protein